MEKLYELAKKSFDHSYSPYSKFKVGASVLLKDGTMIGGANVENASYGLSNCAERTTLFSVYSQGYKKDDIVKMLVIADVTKPISPCGACRQVMIELLNPEVEVILTNLKQETKIIKVKDLLPYSFTSEEFL